MAYEELGHAKRRDGYWVTQRDYDNVLTALERLYAAFPDCEGGEKGAACMHARLAISAANEGESINAR